MMIIGLKNLSKSNYLITKTKLIKQLNKLYINFDIYSLSVFFSINLKFT